MVIKGKLILKLTPEVGEGIGGWKFCRKINSNASKKSELESQMNDLLTKANELKQKINEL